MLVKSSTGQINQNIDTVDILIDGFERSLDFIGTTQIHSIKLRIVPLLP
jgi:hypothetical protein